MHSLLRLLLVCVFSLACLSSTFAAIASRGLAAPRQSIQLNGVDCPVVSWRGGDLAGVVNTGGLGKRQLGRTRVEPVEIEVELPLEPALAAWFSDFATGTNTSRTLALRTLDANNASAHPAFTLANAELVEVRFSALTATAGGTPSRAIFVAQAQASQRSSTGTVAVPAASKIKRVVTGFRVDIAGLETNAVTTAGALTIRRNGGSVDAQMLTLDLAAVTLPAWEAWHDDFVAKGNNADANEKTGKIEWLDATGASAAALHFGGLGLVRLAPTIANERLVWRAQLYFESVSLSAPGKPAAATPTSKSSPESAASFAKVSHPEDARGRDPENFPRPEGSIRRSARLSEDKTVRQEFAGYEVKMALDEAIASYSRSLEGAGWKLLDRSDSMSESTQLRSTLMNWTDGPRWAQLVLSETKDGTVTVNVRVDTKK